jgi:hypothetical protein
MRIRTLLALIPLLLILGVTSAFALKVSPISRFRMHVMCGASENTAGGTTGCSKSCGNTMCSYGCDDKTFKCEKVVYLTTEQPGGKLPESAVDIQTQDSLPPPSLVTPVPGGGSLPAIPSPVGVP